MALSKMEMTDLSKPSEIKKTFEYVQIRTKTGSSSSSSNTNAYEFLTISMDPVSTNLCFARKETADTNPNCNYLIQMKDTGTFGYIDQNTQKIFLLEDEQFETDIYHFFFLEFSA